MFDRFLVPFAERFPTILAAIGILVLGWMAASLLAGFTQRLFAARAFSDRFAKWQESDSNTSNYKLPHYAGKFVFYLVMLLAILAFCEKLGLTVFLDPVKRMLDVVFQYLPQVAGGAILIVLAWGSAKLLRMVVKGLLSSLEIDQRLGKYANISVTQPLADAVYGLTLLFFLPMILDTLGLRSLLAPLNVMLGRIFAFLPNLVAAIVILTGFYIGASILSRITANLLAGVGFNALVERFGFTRAAEDARKPSDIVRLLVLFAIMLLGLSEATNALGFNVLTELVMKFTLFSTQLFVGVIIFAAGAWLANWAYTTILAAGSGEILAAICRAAIWVFVGAMALREIGLANDIINLAFGLLLGSIAIAIAVAFGLGGKAIVARELEEWVQATKKKQP